MYHSRDYLIVLFIFIIKMRINQKIKSEQDKELTLSFRLMDGVFLTGIIQPERLDLEKFKFSDSPKFTSVQKKIFEELRKNCPCLSHFPETETLLVTDKSFYQLMHNRESFVANISESLNITNFETGNAVKEFFENKKLLVQPTGLEGNLYTLGTYLQGLGSTLMTVRTLIMSKPLQVTGLPLLEAQPFLVVAVPTVGAIFFYSCGSIIGNNTVGKVFNTVGNVLSFPMVGTELVYNRYIGPFLNSTIGVKTVLNLTQQIKRGPGLDALEALQLLRSNNNSMIQSIKTFVGNRIKNWFNF
jgi:hypothetical protein